MIEMKDVTVKYPNGDCALSNLNILIDDGEFVSIIGKSGAGKSSLLKLLYAEIKPFSGEVYLNDIRIDKLDKQVIPALRRSIGIIFQDYKLLPTRSVYDNVALALKATQCPQSLIENKVYSALEKVGLQGKENKYPSMLSGGEQQRVSIARAIVHDPILIVADEPTGNLDKGNTQEIISILKNINATGTTVILATHDQEVVNLLSKRVITIVEGVVTIDQKVGGRYIV